MATRTIYGPGGYDPTKPNNNVIRTEEYTEDATAVNQRTIVTNLLQDMADIQAEIAKTNATINANPAATIKVALRSQRRIIRKLLDLYDGTD